MEDSDQQSTDSGSLIGSNDDVLTEILLRLPASSILRFKSVSKHWRSLLSHRHFTLRYDRLSKSPGVFVHNTYVPFDVENRSPPPFRNLDFYPDTYGIRIMQSCNGLLLCCSDQEGLSCANFYVFNPTTKQFAIIPSVPRGRKARKIILSVALAFHQTDCVHYKVVYILSRCDGACQIQVYSSETRKWKISVESFSMEGPLLIDGVYWNGAIYWVNFPDSHLYFNLETEQLQTLPFTDQVVSSGESYYPATQLYFGESRGHLHLVETCCHEFNGLNINVYEMLSDYSGWFVKYNIELDRLPGAFPEMMGMSPSSYIYYVSDVVRGEKEEDTFIVVRIPGKMIRYNVHDKSFNKLFDFADDPYDDCPLAHRFTETLTSF